MDGENNYSLDMIRIDFELEKESLQRFYNRYSVDTTVDHWEDFRFKSYKHNFKFKCAENNSFWLGCEPNWKNVGLHDWVIATLEFNPNKLSDDVNLIAVYGGLMVACRDVKCSRFDLAIDIPITRSECILVKDKRKYIEFRNSDSDLTQYLGVKHDHGYIKLYNKDLEQKNNRNELTRLEITVKYKDRADIGRVVPTVFMMGSVPNDLNITGTDKALVYGCLLDMNILNFLDKRKKKKIKDILGKSSLTFEFEPSKYVEVLRKVECYINKSMFIKGL